MASICLNGETMTVADGMSYLELVKQTAPAREDILLVRANGHLAELHKPVKEGDRLSYVAFSELAGYETYRRSISMMFMKAVTDVLGEENVGKIVLHFSISSGFYYTISGKKPACQEFADKVEAEMRRLTEADLPFRKVNMRTADVRKMFRERKMFDKDLLFNYRIVSTTNYYDLDGFVDYNYGYIVSSTGVLKYFKLYAYADGIVLQMPKRKDMTHVPEFVPYRKLFETQVEAEKWAELVHMENVGELNARIVEGNLMNPILMAEAYQERRIAEIASMIAGRSGVKFVMIAGPSSSGKTTFSQRLIIQLSAFGLRPHYIGVDNYFVDRDDTPKDESGNYDFECLQAIDLEGFNRDMSDLLKGKTIKVPSFNFVTGSREYHGETLTLSDEDILVIEGIHCLNDELSYRLPKESKFRIYISAITQLNIDDHDRMPTTDGRLLRRMVRDFRTRGASANRTIGMWESVRRGEEKNIFPYQESADVFFNSALPYELAVMKPFAQPILFQVKEGDPEYEEARRLLKLLDYVLGMPAEKVPDNSILREFIGGGCFHM